MPNVNKSLHACLLLFCAMSMVPVQGFSEYIHESDNRFKYALSSGVFAIHKKALSVDWLLENRSTKPQQYRVTIYEVNSNDREVISPGSLEGVVERSGWSHNANSVGDTKPFHRGRRYEVVVEVNSRKLLPKVEMWSGYHESSVIPETVIKPEKFRSLKQ